MIAPQQSNAIVPTVTPMIRLQMCVQITYVCGYEYICASTHHVLSMNVVCDSVCVCVCVKEREREREKESLCM